jgi:hypothetical protein
MAPWNSLQSGKGQGKGKEDERNLPRDSLHMLVTDIVRDGGERQSAPLGQPPCCGREQGKGKGEGLKPHWVQPPREGGRVFPWTASM